MKLALFFTLHTSLKLWVDTGLIDREKLLYHRHLDDGTLQKVYWLTYGAGDEVLARSLHADGRLHPGIEVCGMPKLFGIKGPNKLYPAFLPHIHRRVLTEVDILKTNQMLGASAALRAKTLYHKPLIVRTGYTQSLFDGNAGRSAKRINRIRRLECRAYQAADLAVVASENDRQYLLREYHLPEDNIQVLVNYIDTDLFRPDPRIPKKPDRLLCVGRMDGQKNLFNLIEAAAKLGLPVDVYGQGPFKPALIQHARRLNARVNFLGTVPNHDLPAIYNQYRYYLLPSLYEGMPKTLLEAMACGMVCIGTDTEGIREVITDRGNGYLIPGVSAAAIESAIHDAMNQDNDALSRAAVQTVRERFSLDAVARKEQLLLRSLRDK